jgi:peptidoglycan/LPS O-acetylase OafA/YrhL
VVQSLSVDTVVGGAAASAPASPSIVSAGRVRASRYVTHVEGMRAVAALVVYLNHAYAQAFHTDGVFSHPEGLLSLARYSMVAGHLAVTVFIVISGFCLTLPVVAAGDRLRGGTAAFIKRRARRILPAYYGSVALALVLIWTIIGTPTGTSWDVPIYLTPSVIISHLLMMQDLFATGRINYVLWSIAVEWHIYFLFPLLVWAWRRFGPARTIAVTLAVGVLLNAGFYETRIGRANPHYVAMFTLGMLAAYVTTSTNDRYVRLRQNFPWRLTAIAGLSIAAALAVTWDIRLSMMRFPAFDVPVGVMAASLLVLASNDGGILARVFSWKPLVTIGTFSYSLYLIHAPLLQVLWQYLLQPAGVSRLTMFWFLMTIGLGLILLASYGFYRLFEEPFMRAAKSARLKDEAAVPASVSVGVV